MTNSDLDIEKIIVGLAGRVEAEVTERSVFAAICSGGVVVRDALLSLLPPPSCIGTVDIGLHRDDFGLHRPSNNENVTNIPIDLDGREVFLIDDVIQSGRTARAAINEIFDYGRPACIKLVTLIDRGGREIPIQPDFNGVRLTVGHGETVRVYKRIGFGLTVDYVAGGRETQ